MRLPDRELGYTRHLHGIRSYEKLTSEGVTMRGPKSVTCSRDTAPRFGGAATDYQLVEETDGPCQRSSLIVSPRVGPVDESGVVEVVLAALCGRGPGAAGGVQDLAGRGDATRRPARAVCHARPARSCPST